MSNGGRPEAAGLKEFLRGLSGGAGESFPDRKPGAVSVIFMETDDGPALVFTLRTPDLKEHAGQISFPGGAVEPDDPSLLDAAFRETWEEIGIAPEELEPLGALPLQPVLDYWVIHPFLAWWPRPRPLRPNPAEVARIIITPLTELVAQHQRECWLIPDPAKSCRYYISGETLWGATARIVGRLLDRLSEAGF